MKNQIKLILKISVLLLLWLIFSPLFLWFSIKWNIPKLVSRIILTIIAPFTLLIFLAIYWQGYDYYYHHIKRGSRSELETKTSIIFPKFHTANKKQFVYGSSFNGDFTMEYTVKLDTNNIQVFYEQIEQQIQFYEKQEGKYSAVDWSIDKEGNYFFTYLDIENGDDETLELYFNKKDAKVKIVFGQM